MLYEYLDLINQKENEYALFEGYIPKTEIRLEYLVDYHISFHCFHKKFQIVYFYLCHFYFENTYLLNP